MHGGCILNKFNILKSSILSIIILTAGGLGFYYLSATTPESAKRNIEQKPIFVNITKIIKGTYKPVLSLYGVVEAPQTTTISAEANGKILNINVKEGQSVEKGQLLIKIDDTSIKLQKIQKQADIQDVESQIAAENNTLKKDLQLAEHEKELVNISENTLKRQNELIKKEIISEEDFERTKASHLQQLSSLKRIENDIRKHKTTLISLNAKLTKYQAILKQNELDINKTTVKAPYDGVIKSIAVSIGENAQINRELLEIANEKFLEVRSLIPQKYLPQVIKPFYLGDKISAVTFSYDKKINLTLNRLSRKNSGDRVGIDAILSINTAAPYLSAGQKIALDLYLPETSTLFVLPSSAFYLADTVYKVVGNYLEGVQVTREGHTIINGKRSVLFSSDDIKPGDRIVTSLMASPSTGQLVKVQND